MIATRLVRLAAPARAAVASMAVRSFTAPSAPLMKDVIKELYINELKGYKPTPEAKGVDASQAKDFKAPVAPQTPVIDAAADLAAWETANQEVVDAVSQEAAVEDEEDEEEVEEAEAHH